MASADDLSGEQKKMYAAAFKKYADAGKLRAKKLSVAIRDLGFSIKGDELQSYFKAVGVEISGSLDLTQFYTVMAMKYRRADNSEDIIAAFKGFDPDKDSMSAARFRKIMTEMGAKLNKEEIDELMKEVQVGDSVPFSKIKEVVLS